MAGLIKSLEQILAEVEAARQAEDEAARSEAKAKEKEEAERLRRERLEARKRREGRPAEPSRAKTEPREPLLGVVSWIAGLPSEISWRVPVAGVAIVLLGWFLPGKLFMPQGSLGWGMYSLLYGISCLLLVGVIFYSRRKAVGGTELALYWLAAGGSLAAVTVSAVNLLGLANTNGDSPVALIAILTAAFLVGVRRRAIGGLEFSLYWFGSALMVLWGSISFLAGLLAGSAIANYFNDTIHGYRSAGIVLSSIAIASAVIIIACPQSQAERAGGDRLSAWRSLHGLGGLPSGLAFYVFRSPDWKTQSTSPLPLRRLIKVSPAKGNAMGRSSP